MKQDVLITLRGTQKIGNDDPETVELITRGILRERNEKYSVSYTETELTGTPGVITTFFIPHSKRVVLSREGPIRSKMVFVEGEKDESLYDLGFGSLLIGIQAHNIDVNLSQNGGTIRIDYIVEVEQSHTSHNQYELLIQPLSET